MPDNALQQDAKAKDSSGIFFAVGAFACWGLIPVYFKILQTISGDQILAHRIMWTIPVCLVILLVKGSLSEFFALWRHPMLLFKLALSATCIGANWLVFILAVNSGHVLATSLAYYLNPLLNVLLGALFLGERLPLLGKVAVGIACVGVAILLAGALDTLWIALTLSMTFALYGFIRKTTNVSAAEGLAVETCLLLPLALGYLFWLTSTTGATFLPEDGMLTFWLLMSGIVTGVPMTLFAAAARRIQLATLGFIQYLAPSMTFLLGSLVYGEPLDPVRLACFALIWLSIAVFTYSSVNEYRKRRRNAHLPASVRH